MTGAIRWEQAGDPADARALDAWCAAVGPAVLVGAPPDTQAPSETFAVVTWNVNIGGGDVAALVRSLRRGAFTHGVRVDRVVLLLQEVFRSGPAVPAALPEGAAAADRHQPAPPDGPRVGIVDMARALGLFAVYVPAMRNGRDAGTREDRGDAILTTDPITDVVVTELPFERQRRLAVTASVALAGDGSRWRVTSVHLDNRAGARRWWIDSAAARTRQARALAGALAQDRTDPGIVGGDLNTWRGVADPAYAALARVFSSPVAGDGRATFAAGRRLDHLLFRLPPEWHARVTRLDRFGSDHHPLLAVVSRPRDGR